MPKLTTEIIAEPGMPQILINRGFEAPRELLFRAFTEPELLVRWLGPRNLTMQIDRFDVRDGGTWRYVHTEEDGTEHGFHGVFHGTPSLDGIVQTFEYEGWPGNVALESMTFEEQDGGTLVRQNSVFQSVAARDAMIESGMEIGVTEGFDRLDELIESLTAAR